MVPTRRPGRRAGLIARLQFALALLTCSLLALLRGKAVTLLLIAKRLCTLLLELLLALAFKLSTLLLLALRLLLALHFDLALALSV